MTLIKMAWKNLWRNRRRTIITLSAIAFSIMLVQALDNLSYGVYAGMVDSGVRAGSGHIAIYRSNYLESRDESLQFKDGTLIEEISGINGVEQVLPRLYVSALAQSSRESRGVVLMGIEPVREREINPFLKNLSTEEMIRSNDSRDAVVGVKLLDELQISAGQKFVVTAQHKDGTLHSELLRVRGIVNTGMKDIDKSLILIGRERAALLTGTTETVHELAIILTSADLEVELYPEIKKKLVGKNDIIPVSWDTAMPNLANAIKLDYSSQKFIFAIILLIVTIGIVNTLLMSVMERMREFGVILALGSKPSTLRIMIFMEALSIGLLGALIGTGLGSLLTWYLVEVGLNLSDFVPETLEFGGVVFDPIMRAGWNPLWMFRVAFYAVGLTLLAAVYPALKAGRITPVEGMRHS